LISERARLGEIRQAALIIAKYLADNFLRVLTYGRSGNRVYDWR
jgi:hypothetical protein